MTAQSALPLGCLPRLGRVLIGSSLEKDSNLVVSIGAAVASAAHAKIHLVHVAPVEPVASGPDTGGLLPGICQDDTECRERLLWDQAERQGLDPEELSGLKVLTGTPHREIVETARRIGAGLIVVGASEPGAHLGTRLLGSTAERVVRQAACPVLVVRGALPIPPRRVLLPIDLSAASADAVRCGLHLLGQISGGAAVEIEAFYALDFLTELEFLHPHMPWLTTSQQVERHTASELEQFVLAACEEAPGKVRTEMRLGDAREEILDELVRKPADLVVLGTHGRSGLDRLLLGSVASAVLRRAPCSVLMVPPDASLGQAIAEAVAAETAPDWRLEQEPESSKDGIGWSL